MAVRYGVAIRSDEKARPLRRNLRRILRQTTRRRHASRPPLRRRGRFKWGVRQVAFARSPRFLRSTCAHTYYGWFDGFDYVGEASRTVQRGVHGSTAVCSGRIDPGAQVVLGEQVRSCNRRCREVASQGASRRQCGARPNSDRINEHELSSLVSGHSDLSCFSTSIEVSSLEEKTRRLLTASAINGHERFWAAEPAVCGEGAFAPSLDPV
jgi:hypothetical protein